MGFILTSKKTNDVLKISAVIFILTTSIFLRLRFFNTTGKDIYAYEKSVIDLLTGVNPYKWTIESYSNPDDPGNHGYAYLPLMMYMNSFFYCISLISGISFTVLSKIPVLLADFGIGYLILKFFKGKSFVLVISSLLLWFWNPYFFLKNNYVYTDPIVIFFMMSALYFLEKDDVTSGALYALAVASKPFPIILLPIFIFRSKKPVVFLLSSFIVGIFLSLPFLTSVENFLLYINGSVFIHGERFVTGRPFLFFISYYGKIELFRTISVKVYAYLSTLLPWVASTALFCLFKLKDKYVLSLISICLFLLFTPVLNKTYLMWAVPLVSFGTYNIFRSKYYLHLLASLVFWSFYYIYLFYWKDGFHIWHP